MTFSLTRKAWTRPAKHGRDSAADSRPLPHPLQPFFRPAANMQRNERALFMAYATINELTVRLGQDYSGLYGNNETAQADLDAAAAEIDAAAGCRYETPVVSVRAEALLRDWNLTLCEERARMRCAGDVLPEKLRMRIEHVRDSLAKTASGELVLPGAAENMRGMGFAAAACEEPVFTRETMKGY